MKRRRILFLMIQIPKANLIISSSFIILSVLFVLNNSL